MAVPSIPSAVPGQLIDATNYTTEFPKMDFRVCIDAEGNLQIFDMQKGSQHISNTLVALQHQQTSLYKVYWCLKSLDVLSTSTAPALQRDLEKGLANALTAANAEFKKLNEIQTEVQEAFDDLAEKRKLDNEIQFIEGLKESLQTLNDKNASAEKKDLAKNNLRLFYKEFSRIQSSIAEYRYNLTKFAYSIARLIAAADMIHINNDQINALHATYSNFYRLARKLAEDVAVLETGYNKYLPGFIATQTKPFLKASVQQATTQDTSDWYTLAIGSVPGLLVQAITYVLPSILSSASSIDMDPSMLRYVPSILLAAAPAISGVLTLGLKKYRNRNTNNPSTSTSTSNPEPNIFDAHPKPDGPHESTKELIKCLSAQQELAETAQKLTQEYVGTTTIHPLLNVILETLKPLKGKLSLYHDKLNKVFSSDLTSDVLELKESLLSLKIKLSTLLKIKPQLSPKVSDLSAFLDKHLTSQDIDVNLKNKQFIKKLFEQIAAIITDEDATITANSLLQTLEMVEKQQTVLSVAKTAIENK